MSYSANDVTFEVCLHWPIFALMVAFFWLLSLFMLIPLHLHWANDFSLIQAYFGFLCPLSLLLTYSQVNWAFLVIDWLWEERLTGRRLNHTIKPCKSPHEVGHMGSPRVRKI